MTDGDCGFCQRSVRFLQRRVHPAATIATSQSLDLAALGLTAEQCDAALQWVPATGSVLSGHRAVAAVLRTAPRWWWRALGRVLTWPGASALAGVAYRWTAEHRQSLPGGTPACALPPPSGAA